MPLLAEPLYVVPFLIAQFALGWRTLLAAAIVDVASMIYIANCDGDGPSAVKGVAIVSLVLIAFSAGLVTRVVTIFLAPFSKTPILYIFVTTLGFFMLPASLWFDVSYSLLAIAVIFALPYGAWAWLARTDEPTST